MTLGEYPDGVPEKFLIAPEVFESEHDVGRFEDAAPRLGLDVMGLAGGSILEDFDGDGYLDVMASSWGLGDPLRYFRNNGDGTFSDRTREAGLTGLTGGLNLVQADYDNDGHVDVLVLRGAFLGEAGRQPNSLLRNLGDGSFADVTRTAGVAEPIISFPAWFWDYDNDGWLDLFVSGYGVSPDPTNYGSVAMGEHAGEVAADYLGLASRAITPRLYRNSGDGTFLDVTREARLNRVLYTMGGNFGDLDNDGLLDFYAGTGAPDLRALMPNRMFRNEGGRVFQDVTTSGGFGHLQKGHGISFGDLDQDGDPDIYAVMGGSFSADGFQNVLFENPGHGNHWITLRLVGSRSNRSALAARLRITVSTQSGERDIYATVGSGGSFGASSLQQEIGLGRAHSIRAVQVTWPSTGRVQVFHGLPVDRIVLIREGDPEPLVMAPHPIELTGSSGH